MFGSHYDEGRVTRILDPDPLWAKLAQRSIDRYRDIEQAAGISFYGETGYACIGAAEHSSYLSRVQRVAQDAGVDLMRLDAAQMHDAFPAMPSADVPQQSELRALLQPTRAGHISPRQMVKAQLQLCQEQGGTVVRTHATAVTVERRGSGDGDTMAIVHLAPTAPAANKAADDSQPQQVLRARKVLVATGAFTTPALTDGVHVPLSVEGRTVVFANVTGLMQNQPELKLGSLPSVIKALSRHDKRIEQANSATTQAAEDILEGKLGRQQEGTEEQAQTPTFNADMNGDKEEVEEEEAKRDQGPLYDLYCLPPIKYPDGQWYIKIGTGDFPNKLPTLEHVLEWFRGPPAGPDVAMLTKELHALYPCLESCEKTTTNCVLTYTAHGNPIIDWARQDVLAVAVGGNGAAAKSADEIGRLAAAFVLGSPDDTYDMAAFKLPRH